MTLPVELLRTVHSSPENECWDAILEFTKDTCLTEFTQEKVGNEILFRDRRVGLLDLLLSTACWELWEKYESCVKQTADLLANWWAETPSGRAVLVLDCLSLREAPWIISGAKERGYHIHTRAVSGAELPADTTPFAKALGFGQRSDLQNNTASGTHKFTGAWTDSVDIPWEECCELINSAPDWVLWHHWPDTRLHDLAIPGRGITALSNEAREQLCSESFWACIHRLTTGRRLIVTSDHGYAASGLFSDTDKNGAEYLRKRFKSGRWCSDPGSSGHWVPPLDLILETKHGRNALVLGRRKWKSPHGYPTLAHGGLTLLEVLVPFVEISRPQGGSQ